MSSSIAVVGYSSTTRWKGDGADDQKDGIERRQQRESEGQVAGVIAREHKGRRLDGADKHRYGHGQEQRG